MFSLSAQTPRRDSGADGLKAVTALKIGENIPQQLWDLPMSSVNTTGGKRSLTLADYADRKLVLLDFWGTWCKSCIEGFPNLERLQMTFQDSLAVLLINTIQTRDSENKISSFFANYNDLDPPHASLPSIIRDSILLRLFPHTGVPHTVWLGRGLKYLGTGSPHALNRPNIRKYLDRGNADFLQERRSTIRSSVFEGYRSDSNGTGLLMDTLGDILHYQVSNQPLHFYYKTALDLKGSDIALWKFDEDIDNYIVHKVKFPRPEVDFYCYDLKLNRSLMTAYGLKADLKNGLETIFGVRAGLRKGKTTVLCLSATSALQRYKSSNGIRQVSLQNEDPPFFFRNTHISFAKRFFASLFHAPVEIMDDGLDIRLDLDLPPQIFELDDAQLKIYLQGIGIQCTSVQKDIEYLNFKSIINEK
jgi:thiol-disulfide isomerase/thioredoxin